MNKYYKIYFIVFVVFILFILLKVQNNILKLKIYEDFKNKNKYNTYGGSLIEKLIEKNYKIIIGDGNIPSDNMFNIYKKTFICLRLTKHDGIANGINEAGLMGIKTLHNGDSPAAINYESLEHIIKSIENEKKKIGTIDYELAKKTKKYLDYNPKTFLNLKRHFDEKPEIYNTEIDQLYTSDSLKFFDKVYKNQFENLKTYHNKNKPALFFGVYTNNDLNKIINHKSGGLIIWGGSDAMNSNNIKKLKHLDKKYFKHISISEDIKNDLQNQGIDSTRINFHAIKMNNYKPVKKGKYIYAYCPNCGIKSNIKAIEL